MEEILRGVAEERGKLSGELENSLNWLESFGSGLGGIEGESKRENAALTPTPPLRRAAEETNTTMTTSNTTSTNPNNLPPAPPVSTTDADKLAIASTSPLASVEVPKSKAATSIPPNPITHVTDFQIDEAKTSLSQSILKLSETFQELHQDLDEEYAKEQRDFDRIVGTKGDEFGDGDGDGDSNDENVSTPSNRYHIFQNDESLHSPASASFIGLTSRAKERLSPAASSLRSSRFGNASSVSHDHSHAREVRKVNNSTLHMMNKAKRKIDKDKNDVTAEMRRFAIHETEKRLNEMRQKHVRELADVTGDVIQTAGVALVHQDDMALKKLQRAMEAKRDQILADEKVRIEASLNLELKTMAHQHDIFRKGAEGDAEHFARAELKNMLAEKERTKRLELALVQTEQALLEQVEKIKSDNAKETQRVFGELAVALENGAKANINQLVDSITKAREEKEANLISHSEKLVSEAMESLASELLDVERTELHTLRVEAENGRLELLTKTRFEGVEAVAREVESEKIRLRARKTAVGDELRSALEETAENDLRELEEALQSDLEIAESLMLDSVRNGLAGSLQQAKEEHAAGFPVDEGALEKLNAKLKEKHLKIVVELPRLIESGRLRHIHVDERGEGERGGEFSLTHLRKTYETLNTNFEELGNTLGDTVSEVKSLRRELKKIDPAAHAYLCGGYDSSMDAATIEHLITKSCEVNFDRGNNEYQSKFGMGVGRGNVSCKKCSKLYRMNGELLQEINESNNVMDIGGHGVDEISSGL